MTTPATPGREPTPLEAATAVVDPAEGLPILEHLITQWPSGPKLREEMYRRDLETHTQPPVIHVTVAAPPDATPPDGFFAVVTGPSPAITYHPEPDEVPGTRTLSATAGAAQAAAAAPGAEPGAGHGEPAEAAEQPAPGAEDEADVRPAGVDAGQD